MNIDKFGHSVHKRLRFSEILDLTDNSLVKSEKGHYDAKSCRLTGIKEPLTPDDAANKKYVDEKVLGLCTKKEISTFMITIKEEIASSLKQFEKTFCTKDYAEKLIARRQ